jgi:hypothetical protein
MAHRKVVLRHIDRMPRELLVAHGKHALVLARDPEGDVGAVEDVAPEAPGSHAPPDVLRSM